MNGIGRGIRSVFFSSLNSDEGIIEVINGVISDSRIFYPQSQVHLVAAHGGVSVVLDIDVFKFSVTVILKEGKIGRAHVELQSLMRISYAVFCLKKKTHT